jgi:hypothetical protein
MKKVGMAMLLCASPCGAQEPGSYQPAAINVHGATYAPSKRRLSTLPQQFTL